jgi:hypothetical protein
VIQIATDTLDNLKHSPALLAIVVLQLATLAVIYFVASGNAERVQARELALISACGGSS